MFSQREDALAEAYSRRAAEWLRRVERIEQGQKRKAKDARNREFFEKVNNILNILEHVLR